MIASYQIAEVEMAHGPQQVHEVGRCVSGGVVTSLDPASTSEMRRLTLERASLKQPA
jgi:hypothetical protein